MTAFHGSFLRFNDQDGRQHELMLSAEQPRITIGRSPQADLSLAWDAEVSRLHATLEFLTAHWTIVDDGLSRNGTFVNGDRLVGRHRLQPGDVIRMGTSRVTFQDFGPAAGDVTRTSTGGLPTLRSLTETQRSVLIALCRPLRPGNDAFASPASNQQIAAELFLSVDAIKTHLRALFAKFGVEDLPQNQKRVKLANLALQTGIISERDL